MHRFQEGGLQVVILNIPTDSLLYMSFNLRIEGLSPQKSNLLMSVFVYYIKNKILERITSICLLSIGFWPM